MPSYSTPEVVETSFKLNPHWPRITKESSTRMEFLGKSRKVINILFHLFSDILYDVQLTDKLPSTIKFSLGD
jgi:hypothetical protein